MKKTTKIILSLVLLAGLSGCEDATAKLKDANTTLIKVGKTAITKGDLYNHMVGSTGSSTVISKASTLIAQEEIPVTDEMKADAQESLDSYKAYYGDPFVKHLEQIGMSEEEYLNENLIASLQAAELPKKYIEENFNNLASTYSPIKAILLDFSSQDDANKALAELKEGKKDLATIVADNNSTSSTEPTIYTINSTSIDSVVRTVLTSTTPADGWIKAAASDGASYVVLKVEENDPEKFKDEAIDALSSISVIQNESTNYWFTKYNFHIYDKTIYDSVKTNYPTYLVQDITPTPTPTPETTEE
ncbi:MAG: hypothetical protein IJ875_02605 [Solobacterium sp.]|nr:hypothetical protein [Solobacterium sp.]